MCVQNTVTAVGQKGQRTFILCEIYKTRHPRLMEVCSVQLTRVGMHEKHVNTA